jgi:hypothetical protein
VVLHADRGRARRGVQLLSATYADLASREAASGLTRLSPGKSLADALSRLALPLALAGTLSIVPNVATAVRERESGQVHIYSRDSATFNEHSARTHHISELGWTREQAAAVRHQLAAWAEDWNDPAMDVYDAL